MIDAIAIIAMEGRFPGAKTLPDFWQRLSAGDELITHFDDQTLLDAGVDAALLKNPNYVKARGVLDDADLFDADFFGVSPRDAAMLDPQQRLFLKVAWQCMEKAAYVPEKFDGKMAIFAGCSESTYLGKSGDAFERYLSSSGDFLATRAAYKLNFNGPAVTLNTACSTSLVAVINACRYLLNYDCDLALAGGVSLRTPQLRGYLYQDQGIESPDGHCRAFDAEGRGTVLSAGVGLVMLRRLEDAERDGDDIKAVIVGSAINNDGDRKVGYTAPSVSGQAECISEALISGDIDPATIGYVEAHGTATALGDPIEVAALTKVYRRATDKKQYCALGSLKSNMGHADSAAGIAGLIKAVLSLQHKQIPPSLHFSKPNPEIDFDSSPFYVNTALKAFEPQSGAPLRAAVSAFGIGGTNAHLILQQAPQHEPAGEVQARAFQLSAKSKQALDVMTDEFTDALKKSNNLADVAYTLRVGRKDFAYKRVLIRRDANNIQSLTRAGQQSRPLVFMYPGQGAQYATMGLPLYETEPVFKQAVDECCKILSPLLKADLRSILFDDAGHDALRDTAFTQPALFVIHYALSRLFMSWGIAPDAFIGHSIGEYTAAYFAGVFSLKDVLHLLVKRGQLMSAVESGTMLSVGLPADQVKSMLPETLSLAAINAPNLCVVSGESEAVDRFEKQLGEDVVARRLHTSHAFHSAMMDAILDKYKKAFDGVPLNKPSARFISNVSGEWVLPEQATDPDYWVKHLRHAVNFSSGISRLIDELHPVFLELGPGYTLSALTKQQLSSEDRADAISTLSGPKESDQQIGNIDTALSKLWLANVKPNWQAVYQNKLCRRVELPTYAFQEKSFWFKTDDSLAKIMVEKDCHEWLYYPSWLQTEQLTEHVEALLAGRTFRWLVFSDSDNAIVDRLQALGQSVEHINSKVDYKKLFEKDVPTKVLDLRNLGSSSSFEGAEEKAFYNPLTLAQAYINSNCQQPLKIIMAADQVYDVLGNENISPVKRLLKGPCSIISHEEALIDMRCVDVGVLSGTELADYLIKEAMLVEDNVSIAYRGKSRWREAAAKQRQKITSTPLLKRNGVYVVVGGSGGVGLALSEFLRRHYRAKVISLSRSSGCDITDADQARRAFEKILNEHGEINGVIHAAGLAGDGFSRFKTREMASRVIAPKLKGAYVLLDVLKDLDLDFVLFCSSVNALVPWPGQVDYCAANACLDAIAEANLLPKTKLVSSVNWTTWKETGMAKTAPTVKTQAGEEVAITAEEGQQLFANILEQQLSRAIVSPVDPADYDKLSVVDIQQSEPTKNTPKTIEALFSDLLGIENLPAEADFFELGGHSLLALQLISKLESDFDIKMTLTELYETKTPEKIAQKRRAIADKPESSLVAFNKRGSCQTLFLIHPVGGTSFCYAWLAKALADDRPVYAMHDPGIQQPAIQFNSIEDIAKLYLQEIKKVQPQGPYLLGGASYGGTLAFEMAKQLERQGEECSGVVLFDSWAHFADKSRDEAYFKQSMQQQHVDLQKRLAELPDQMRISHKPWLDMQWSRMQLLFSYQPKKIRCPIVLFKAAELLPQYQSIDDKSNHWQQYSTREVKCFAVQGNHETMMYPPQVVDLAIILKKQLEKLTVDSTVTR